MMDGTVIVGMADEITITTKGILILGSIAVSIITWVLIKHLRDCSGHRATFHDADRKIEQRLATIETDILWIKRALGWKEKD